MAPPLFWVLLVAGLIVSLPIGWRIGYRAGRRDHSELPAHDWDEHVDQALALCEEPATVTPLTDRVAAIQRHPSNVRYLRDRRDKLT